MNRAAWRPLGAVGNVDRPPLSAAHRRYRGRTGFAMSRVWTLLGQTQVQRQVRAQGTLSLWDRPVHVGMRIAGQTVTVRFDPHSRQAVITDAHETVVTAVRLPWLTKDWLWAPVTQTTLPAHPPDPSQCT